MRRILLDENAPAGLRDQLPGHDVRTAADMGWAGLTNGRLLDEAERARFDIMITGDKNLVSQQRLVGRKFALVVMSTTHWPTIRQHLALIRDAVARAAAGTYLVVDIPQSPHRAGRTPGGG